MASPVADQYSGASGGSIVAGRYRMPAWRRAMAPRTWAAIPASNLLADLDPKKNPEINPNYPNSPEWSGGHGFPGIILPWCGAAWAEERCELRLPLQGGHGDYAGNEPYAINLNVDVPVWRMLRPPSGAIGNILTTNDGQEATGNYADGRPRAIHSSNKHVYVPGVGFVMAVQGNCSWSAAGGTNRTMLQDDAGEWTYLATNANAGTSTTCFACYDPTRHGLWYMPSSDGRPSFFDLATLTWEYKSTWDYYGTWTAHRGVFIPELDVLAMISVGELSLWNPTTGHRTVATLAGTQPSGLTFSGYSGAEWDDGLGCLCLWHNASDTPVISTLTPGTDPYVDTWTWGTLPVAENNAVTPSACVPYGTYGRFFYSRQLRGFGILNGVSQPIYFYARG